MIKGFVTSMIGMDSRAIATMALSVLLSAGQKRSYLGSSLAMLTKTAIMVDIMEGALLVS